jgi:hypothetical protein
MTAPQAPSFCYQRPIGARPRFSIYSAHHPENISHAETQLLRVRQRHRRRNHIAFQSRIVGVPA